MKHFWPSFFAFLIVVFIMIGLYRRDLMDNALGFLGFYLMVVAYGALAAALFVGSILLWAALSERRQRSNRPVDGAFPLQKYRLKDGRTLIVNPNTMIGPAAYVDKRTGYAEWEHPAGWDVVVRIREMVERANMIRAMFPGDQARMDPHGAMSPPPRFADTRKLLDTTAPRIVGAPAGAAPVPVRPAPVRVDALSAIAHGQPTAPAVGATGDGQIVTWNLAQHQHSRWHGTSQGSGKTNGAKTLLIGMARHGAHLVILDRRRFKDFGEFNGKAELVDTSNPKAFVEVMGRLEEIYRERDRILGAHGAANIDELRQRLVRYVVMVTEFGTLCNVADEEGLLKPALGPLTRIMREAGAAGIHLIFEDQIVEKGKWPRGIAANASGVFTGHLPLNLGAAGGYHHAHQLGKYEFHHDGQTFHTWDLRPITRQLLAAAPAYDPRLAVLDGVARAVGDGERSSSPTPPTPPPSHETNGANERYERELANKWEEVTADFFRSHPDYLTGPARGITDLARAMAEADGEAKPYTAYKGIAHTYYHNFRDSARLPGGQHLGVDITTTEEA